ncbi:MAG TPA: NUDIX domain-containing protein [Candidatus Nanoarchaeia archaeon]|nr:NUDIX domain-containing protein [Candidatus Nanoarchaeia archaeon]
MGNGVAEGCIRVAVDAVVFTVMHDELKVLLITRNRPPFKGKLALPGGFVEENEGLEYAVKRELTEETSVKDIFLRQIGAYGNVKRDPRGRVMSIAFLALIRPDQELASTADALGAEWRSVDDLGNLAFDHKQIIEDALKELRFDIQTTNIAVQILPKRFTLTELQYLYELVLKKPFDKRNFRRRMKELGVLKEFSETKMGGAHRPAQLYGFKDSEYLPLKDRLQVFT